MPFWVGIIVLIVIYNVVAWPLKAARRAAYHPGYHGPWVAAWDGLFGIAVLVALAWYGYHHVPAVHEFFDHMTRAVESTGLRIRALPRSGVADVLAAVNDVVLADDGIRLELR
jgi:hypothetical protein